MKGTERLVGPLFTALLLLGCGGGGNGEPVGEVQLALPKPIDFVIDWNDQHQRISGFGASSAWTGGSLPEAVADKFFSVDKGLGLSLLRLRIAPDGTSGELATAKQAIARGASVWATPWSPPGAWKTSGTDDNGGSLLPEHYQDWANRLAAFATTAASQGIPLVAISAQNEPNWTATWETCTWAPDDLVTFIRDYMGPTFASNGVGAGILGPETIDWTTFRTFADPLLGDGTALAHVLAIATHSYGGAVFTYPTPSQEGKEFWETEVSDKGGGSAAGADATIDSGLRVARLMHDHLTIAEVNAWHYWWLVAADTTSAEALALPNLTLTPRAYAMGNFSKFVRPGFHRIGAAASSAQPGISVTAYRDVPSGNFAIVAINESSTDTSQTFWLTGFVSGFVTPWSTSATTSLQALAPVSVGSSFTYVLPARSIVSFVGTANSAPLPDAGVVASSSSSSAGHTSTTTSSSSTTSTGAGSSTASTTSSSSSSSSATATFGASGSGGAGGSIETPHNLLSCGCRTAPTRDDAPVPFAVAAAAVVVAGVRRRASTPKPRRS